MASSSSSSSHEAINLIFQLNLESPEIATNAARAIKNAIIANPTNKRIYVENGVIPKLIFCISKSQNYPQLAEHIVASLGSLSLYSSNNEVIEITKVLVQCLFSNNIRTAYASIRSLKLSLLYNLSKLNTSISNTFTDSIISIIFKPNIMQRLLFLLQSNDEGIAEVCATVITNIVEHDKNDNFIKIYDENEGDIIVALIKLITKSLHQRCIEACINALNSLAETSRKISVKLIDYHAIIPSLVNFISSPCHPSLRLSACRLLTTFYLFNLLPEGLHVNLASTLTNLLSCSDENCQVLDLSAQTLSKLVVQSQELQRVAVESGAIMNLSTILISIHEMKANNVEKDIQPGKNKQNNKKMNGKSLLDKDVIMNDIPARFDNTNNHEDKSNSKVELKSNILKALASVTDKYDNARDSVISKKLLPIIIDCIHDQNKDIMQGGISCVRSLSRSVKILRKELTDINIGIRMVSLLDHEDQVIIQLSSAALCNLVLEFSPIRKVVVERDGINKIIDLLHSKDEVIRQNSLWVLKNLLFKADMETKNGVLSKLGHNSLRALFSDKEPKIRALAMTIMRNLACSTTADKQNEQLDNLFAVVGEELISMISNVLSNESNLQFNKSNSNSNINNIDNDPGDKLNASIEFNKRANNVGNKDGRNSITDFQNHNNIELVIQSLYVVCNIASGTEKHKSFLLQSDIPQLILQWTCHPDDRIRIAAVWCTINLSWRDRVVPINRPSTMNIDAAPPNHNHNAMPSPPPRRHTRTLRRTFRAADRRTQTIIASGRFQMLRRQHLPPPSTPAGRRILERSLGGAVINTSNNSFRNNNNNNISLNEVSRIGNISSDGGNDDMWLVDDGDVANHELMDEDAAADIDGNSESNQSEESNGNNNLDMVNTANNNDIHHNNGNSQNTENNRDSANNDAVINEPNQINNINDNDMSDINIGVDNSTPIDQRQGLNSNEHVENSNHNSSRLDEDSDVCPSGYEASGSGIDGIDGSAGEGDHSGSNSSSGKSCGYEWRIERLRSLGFECRLRTLVNDPHIEVQGRARAALQLFNCNDVPPLDYSPSSLLTANHVDQPLSVLPHNNDGSIFPPRA